MLKLWRRPDAKAGIWRMRGTIGGRRYDESTGTTSQPHAAAICAARNKEILDRLTFGAERTTCFAEAVEMYLDGGGEARFLEPLVRAFGPRRLADIKQADVAAFVAAAYPTTGPQGVNRQVYTPLIAIYNAAHKAEMGPPPPFRRPKMPRRDAVTFASDDDIAKVLAASSPRLAAAILLMSLGGARASEACRLVAADIDERRGEIMLRQTKNGEPRRVSCGGLLMTAMAAIEPPSAPDAPVFGFAQRHSLNQALTRACKRAGVRAYSTHEIGRHAFAARLLAQGHTLLEVQQAGGWKTYRMVAEVYGHLERSRVDTIVREAGANLVQAVLGERSNVVAIRKNSGR